MPVLHLSNRGYFNPRSREGSDANGNIMLQRCNISIHAPARGATFTLCTINRDFVISIHAPARGATAFIAEVIIFNIFQSTLPRGERRIVWFSPCSMPVFQSTLPRGERHKLRSIAGQGQIFQSTLPRGERLARRFLPHRGRNFNPRSREGSDFTYANFIIKS